MFKRLTKRIFKKKKPKLSDEEVGKLQEYVFKLENEIEKLKGENLKVMNRNKELIVTNTELLIKVKDLEDTNESKNKEEKEILEKLNALQTEKKSLFSRIINMKQKRIQSIRFESRRGHILREFFFTEKTYLSCLTVLQDEYLSPCKKKKLMSKKVFGLIFGKFLPIFIVNKTFLKALQSILFSATRDEELIKLVLSFSKTFKKEYSKYIRSFAESKKKLIELIKKSKKIEKFFSKKEEELKSRKFRDKFEIGATVSLSVHALMILPIQRLPRYSLLLKDLSKFTKKEKAHFESLMEAIKVIENITKYCDSQLGHYMITKLSKEVTADLNSRELLLETSQANVLNEKNKGEKSHIYVFNDLLILKNLKKGKVMEIPLEKDKTKVSMFGGEQILIESAGESVKMHVRTKTVMSKLLSSMEKFGVVKNQKDKNVSVLDVQKVEVKNEKKGKKEEKNVEKVEKVEEKVEKVEKVEEKVEKVEKKVEKVDVEEKNDSIEPVLKENEENKKEEK